MLTRNSVKFYKDFMLLHVEEGKIDDATDFVEKQKEEGIVEETFCAKHLADSRRDKQIPAVVMFSVIGITILFFGMSISGLKIYSETDELKEKYRFLTIAGITLH